MNDDPTPAPLYPIADGPDPAVQELADNIAAASGGAVIPGLAFGVTSTIPNELTEPYTMTHRTGLGIDLDAPGTTDAYFTKVVGFFQQADTTEVVQFLEDRRLHITVKAGKPIDLTGFPKPTKKKTESAEEAPAE